MSSSMSRAVSLPPPPWPRRISSASTRGVGQAPKGEASSEDIVFSQRHVDLVPEEVEEERVALLDAVDRPALHHEAVVAHVGHAAAVAPGEADGEQAELLPAGQGAVDVGRRARGRDAEEGVAGPADELER